MTRGRLLLIEDDARLRTLVEQELTSTGFELVSAATGGDGLALTVERTFDLVILDLNLPDMDGLEVAERLKADDDVPILMLTARGDVASRVDGLYAGANDYLTKPFDVRELIARIHVQLREHAGGEEIHYGDVSFHVASCTVDHGGRTVVLPEREGEILRLLITHPGKVFSRDDLERRLYGADLPGSNTVEVFVYQLRQKLAGIGVEDFIRTIRRKGYMVV